MFPAFFAVLLAAEARGKLAAHRGGDGRGDRAGADPVHAARASPSWPPRRAALLGLRARPQGPGRTATGRRARGPARRGPAGTPRGARGEFAGRGRGPAARCRAAARPRDAERGGLHERRLADHRRAHRSARSARKVVGPLVLARPHRRASACWPMTGAGRPRPARGARRLRDLQRPRPWHHGRRARRRPRRGDRSPSCCAPRCWPSMLIAAAGDGGRARV